MPDPRLTSEQDAELRRLLAESRHVDPVPQDVVQRLDRVLDGLRAETAAPAPVTDLGVRRDRARARRRTVTRLLVAAAAVVVVGVGVGHLVGRTGGGSTSSDSASSVDRGSFSPRPGGAAGAQSGGGSPSAADPLGTSSPGHAALTYQQLQAQLPVTLSSARLGRDVQKAAALAADARLRPGASAIGRALPGWTCSGTYTVVGDADLVLPAVYDGRPTLLLLRPTAAGRQQARVLECGSFTTLRRVVVPGS